MCLFANDRGVKKLYERKRYGLDAQKIIRNRRREIEDVLLKSSRMPAMTQAPLRYFAHSLWRPLATPFRWSLSRERLPGIRDLPDPVIRLIIDYMVTPELPALDVVCGWSG